MEPEFSSAAEFLPKLPKSNLDDRTFEDLVEECILRIPRYCPEWTNYNPGDPGITLVELFAWLVHQMLYRFNQVPRRHYVTFLELLGIRLLPPEPAQTELNFYLSKAQTEPKLIPSGTEVATVRTANQEAVIFTTDRDLIIGQPQIKHVLRANQVSAAPTRESLNNRFSGSGYEAERQWNALEVPIEVFQPCRHGTCFYLVLDATSSLPTSADATRNGALSESLNSIQGNILALTVRGPAAVTTGINPDNPPLRWEVWTGHEWQPGILRNPSDDRTRGFSFDRLGDSGPNPEQEGADIILHLPQQWPAAEFGGYQGHWVRCVYVEPDRDQQQFGYQRSPEITGLSVRAIGGAVTASECITIQEELLGTSNGKPSQVFELRGKPVLARTEAEHIQIRLPRREVENWLEVPHFGDSTADDCHYLIDSQSGQVQFGPLIREPSQLKLQTHERGQIQSWGRSAYRRQRLNASTPPQATPIPAVLEPEDRHEERQYGRVPPMGAEIYMMRYRVGGGSRGNVQAGQLSILKNSIPYVKRVVNYTPAEGGTDAESLDEAIMRVPALLRTRKTAVTPEEFEQTARQFMGSCRIHRAHCVTAPHLASPGIVHILIIPTPMGTASATIPTGGIHPDRLRLSPTVIAELQAHLDTHKALGIRVKPDTPEYVGVQIQAQIIPYPQYAISENHPRLRQNLCDRLYGFLNPINGGFEGEGWPLGRSVRSSDIIALLQDAPEVQYVSDVRLFCLRQYGRDDEAHWRKTMAEDLILLRELEVVCSWSDSGGLQSGHDIEILMP
jgi:predicted phage baseplate assembly protein